MHWLATKVQQGLNYKEKGKGGKGDSTSISSSFALPWRVEEIWIFFLYLLASDISLYWLVTEVKQHRTVKKNKEKKNWDSSSSSSSISNPTSFSPNPHSGAEKGKFVSLKCTMSFIFTCRSVIYGTIRYLVQEAQWHAFYHIKVYFSLVFSAISIWLNS